jgi:hypothetical protein
MNGQLIAPYTGKTWHLSLYLLHGEAKQLIHLLGTLSSDASLETVRKELIAALTYEVPYI